MTKRYDWHTDGMWCIETGKWVSWTDYERQLLKAQQLQTYNLAQGTLVLGIQQDNELLREALTAISEFRVDAQHNQEDYADAMARVARNALNAPRR